jgi:hypothetical protein
VTDSVSYHCSVSLQRYIFRSLCTGSLSCEYTVETIVHGIRAGVSHDTY